MLGVKVTGLKGPRLLCGDVVHQLGQGGQVATCVPAEDPLTDLLVTHTMDDQLVDHEIPVGVVEAAGALHGHAAHVRGGGHPGHVRADSLVRLLGQLIQVPEVHGLVDCHHGELLHLLQEEGLGGEGRVHAGVEHTLQE